MAGFRFDLFKGIRPRVSKRKLPPGEAQSAQNTRLGSADLEPWDENRLVTATDDQFQTRTVFLYEDSQTGLAYWFQWTDFVDVARGPIKGDTFDRVYYTGDGTPKMTYNSIQSAAPYPSVAYELGIPKPLTRLTGAGQPLPEDQDPAARRTSQEAGERPQTGSFEIVNVEFTNYPGTGTPNDTWRYAAGALGDIILQLNVGDTLKVLEVIDENRFTVGSATGTGAVAATPANDKTSVNYWQPMDEQGSTQTADFIGWRIPDGMRVTVPGHRLRVGDVIRVTRLDQSFGFNFVNNLLNDLFELSPTGEAGEWGVPIQGDDNIYRHENVRLGDSADGASPFELGGGFYYDVDRQSSDNAVLEDRTYVYTYVSEVGEEGPPSDPSSLVQALDGDTVTLTGFDLSPTGFRNIDRVRIYRTNATSVGTEYQFVREVTLAQIQSEGNATDTVPAALLGEIVPSTTWFPPPADMQGITTMPNGMMVGFAGKNIFFSEPFQPHAWPPEYDQAVDYEVVALAPFGNSVAVLTKGTPYVITGSHPRNANIRPYKINQACSYKESVALANDRVYYASPDGLVEIGVNGSRVVTEPYVWKKEWAQFQPELMVGEFYDGKYVGFFGADNTVVPQPVGTLAATGTLVTDDETFESDIVSGGKTIILTLTDDTWVAAGDAFDAVRDDIIFSITADQSEGSGWNNIRGDIPVTNVVRTSDTVVTITLPALTNYSINSSELITFRAPALAVTNRSTLIAPERTTIFADSIYATEAIVTTSWSVSGSQGNVPDLLVSDENIDNWIRITAPADTPPDQAIDLTDAAYHKSTDRWVACGEAFLRSDQTRIYSADVFDDENGWVIRSASSFPRARTAIYDDVSDAVFVGADGIIFWSIDAINWSSVGVPTTAQGRQVKGFARAPGNAVGGIPYVYGIFEDSKIVMRSARLDSQPLSTRWEAIDTLTGPGSGATAIASGNGAVYVAEQTKIGYYIQGDDTYVEIGNLTNSIAGLVYGNGRLVAISDNGSIQYVDAPDETVIGNWSTAVPVATGGSNARIEYDEGGNGKIGYGFIVTLSGFSGPDTEYRVYTSPDAINWTLRETVNDTQDALGIGVKFPESDLEGTLGATVNLSGESAFYWEESLETPPLAQLRILNTGRIQKRRDNFQWVNVDPLTDWIIPNFFANDNYQFRVTNVQQTLGSGGFTQSPAADGTWVNVSAIPLVWAVQNGIINFTLQVRLNTGPVLAEAQYTLGSRVYFNPRGPRFERDLFDIP